MQKENLNQFVLDMITGEMVDPRLIQTREKLEDVQLEYNYELSVEENIKTLEQKIEYDNKYNKLIDDMSKINMNYDPELSLEENDAAYKIGYEDYKKELEQKRKNKPKSKPKEVIKYKYPFDLHYAARNIEIDHIFKLDHEYTEEEITSKMLEHRYYEFGGKVSYEYRKDENVLIPIFKQHKKG